ncbi:HlyD family efflux transporter periplasmic adaptor subunit [Arcobacter cryaerophilus gv. pseudocryaerophilus]|uniref:HlyD family efflux transporter periplasmic adaptor subunit n=3 Tax=Arcobacteraceae TaxID=2808963 RepID=A0AA96DV84_9BACT|nr:HlyD family efflux transporter periplasmic adaptor subunit [Arcobacter sp. AZ-2023]WNL36745.1 HlyD family efflux transporter periplasmic adaptor subunit [Arcobacter sp. AZ-2023]WPD12461.1 HlyD family efflux transporter periplasmic adaptor subunit [Arcobacter sp. DSM 115960]
MFAQEQKVILPKIRDDLKLLETSVAEDGSKRWLLFDPIQNKYFNIGIDAFDLISNWQSDIELEEFIKILEQKDYEIDTESLQTFVDFLINNNLIVCEDLKYTNRMKNIQKQSKQNIFKWLIHNYLFIRIPLVKPDYWLEKNKKKVDFLYSNLWQNIVLFLGFIGIVFVLRDWENFISTFMYLFSKEGFFYYFLSLVFVKSLHELGHAFTAKRLGCKVPTMGVAFLVLFPVLYTDTTNAWKLKSKYQRLKIVVAGIKVELYLALIATFLWSFAPEGIFKSILFIIATTSWISSLLINISPFLRFDGYYALSDMTDSKNLQPRSFAMARWFIRKNILGLNEQKPEFLTKKKENFFIIYAILTWIYRFFLFLGIALLVYYFAFKVLGIILFLVEIIWFILLPVYKELKIWWSKRENVSLNKRNISSLTFIFVFLLLIFIPWNSSIKMPAIIETQNYFEFYPAEDAYIEKIYFSNAQIVKKDDLLLKIKSPMIEHKIEQVLKELEQIKLEINKQAGFKENLNRRFVLEENLLKKENELEGLQKVKEKFEVRASFNGKIYFTNSFKQNQWISKKEPVFVLYDNLNYKIVGFCNENDFKLLKQNSEAKFIFSSGDTKDIKTTVKTISKVSIPYLEYIELSSDFSGDIATRQDLNKQLKTEQAYYKILINLEDKDLNFITRNQGVLVTQGEYSSIISKLYKKIISVIIRESSF